MAEAIRHHDSAPRVISPVFSPPPPPPATLWSRTVIGAPGSIKLVQGLRMRQLDGIPNVPAMCRNDCSPFAGFLAGASCPVTQCCIPLFEAGFFNCFLCIGQAQNVTDFSIAQTFVDVLTTSCTAEGLTLPELTFPGQDPQRTLATMLPPGASTAPIFPSVGQTVPPRSSSAQITITSQSGASGASAPTSSHGTSSAPRSTVTAPLSQSPPTSLPSLTGTAPPSTTSNGAGIVLEARFGLTVGISAVMTFLISLA
ncbi:hypothetical protein C8J57DRAFT_1292042 [Mycena rebaudengoi]|nr:hypothetical protein C8J57DRAFT_1292042 [Mycena rebaudengoi]